MNNSKKRSLVFAPMPPPLGGIASLAATLYKGIGNHESVLFEHPVSKNDKRKTDIARLVANLKFLFGAVLKIQKNGRVLFFSSAFASFWEKMIWARMVLLLGRKPVIVMVDGNFPRFYLSLSKFKKGLANLLMYNKNITIGAQSFTWLKYFEKKFPNVNIEIVSASVDECFFSSMRKKQMDSTQINILYVGWIIEDKGIIDLLDAIELIKNQINGLNVRLVGNLFGKEKFWLQESYRRELSDIVTFTGSINSREDLLKEYQEADIFVFPSHYEGFPVAVLEAISTGLPCICTNVGGVSDILDNGNAGIIIKPHSPVELADAILKLINDESIRNIFSVVAANRAKTTYNFSQLINSYKQILKVND